MISLHCDIKHLVRIRRAAASTKKTLNVCRVHMQVIFEIHLAVKSHQEDLLLTSVCRGHLQVILKIDH